MNANYTEICRVNNLEADFQQVPLVPFFEIFTVLNIVVIETSIIQIQQRNVKNIFLD